MDWNLLPTWQEKPLEEVLERARDLLEDTTYPTVRRWREMGGKVAGHFQVYCPEEILNAAGLLPVKLRGAPVEVLEAESHFGSYLCSILKTCLEVAHSGNLELDLFITHPICDAARNLAGVWARNFPYPAQILYLPQNPNSSHSRSYLRGEYARLLRVAEEVTAQGVSEEQLRASIRLFNENRRLLRELYRIKRETPWKLAVDEAYVLTALAGLIPRGEHNDLLRRLLPQIENRKSRAQDKVRVIFQGGFCEQPPLDLLKTISRSCYVVEDDLLIGLRWLEQDVDLEGDPLEALAEAYLNRSSYSPVQHDLRKPKEEMLLRKLRESKAEAAILTAAKMCEPGLEEQVTYARTLDQERIPYFVSEFEENMSSFEQLEIQLETFVENILFD